MSRNYLNASERYVINADVRTRGQKTPSSHIDFLIRNRYLIASDRQIGVIHTVIFRNDVIAKLVE